ncbi:MAG: radical SAM protein [Lachnospiraceae bacterium]|nr:radical SAM protein [Lachnospiraceae bacterium]
MFTIWTTNQCNLKCKYCYEGDKKINSNMNIRVADATIKWIVEWMKENKENESIIRFHGGEPTLNMFVIKYIIEELKKYDDVCRFSYEITTNGYSLKDEDIDFLTKNMDALSISLDGTKLNNDKYRVTSNGNGTFDAVFKNALKLKNKSDRVTIRMTLKPSEVKNMVDNIMFYVRNGFKSISIAVDIWDDEWSTELLDKVEVVYARLYDLFELEKIEDVEINNIFVSELKKRRCEGGIKGFQIDTNGNLFPCTYTVGDMEFLCGTVFEGIDKKKIGCFEKIYDMPIETCEGCTNYEGCMSVRCKFINKKRMGEFDSPIPILCEIEHRKINYMCKNT